MRNPYEIHAYNNRQFSYGAGRILSILGLNRFADLEMALNKIQVFDDANIYKYQNRGHG